MELIDREALRKDFLERGFYPVFVKAALNDAPVIDAIPAIHGQWVYIGDDEWYCSNCGYIVSTEGRWEPMTDNFCSNCGAKMDKEG